MSNFSRLTTAVLSAALVILFISTTTFFITASVSGSYMLIFFTQMSPDHVNDEGEIVADSWFRVDLFDYYILLAGCTGTVSLTINVRTTPLLKPLSYAAEAG